MKIIIDKEILGGDFSIHFKADNLVDEEFETAVKKFGTRKVDFGGVFTEEVTVDKTVEVTDPDTGVVITETVTETNEVEVLKFNNNLRELTHELNYTRVFKSSQYLENTKKYAEIYAKIMESRINEVLDELRSQNDDFSDSDVIIHY